MTKVAPNDHAPDIFVFDDMHPEDNAMTQAMFSRDPRSIVEHRSHIEEHGSGQSMSKYYVGYNHKSIGDCGGTTISIEQVSMMVAKAIQDNPLYNGQEASTRYLDFARQVMVDPYGHPASAAILDGWMALYDATLPKLVAGLEAKHPFDPVASNEAKWRNANKVRAFDIGRGLLPIGTATLLSWTTNLRQARDHLLRLKHHPLAEVRDVAAKVHAQLLEKYPHSFAAEDMVPHEGTLHRHAARDAYARSTAVLDNYLSIPSALEMVPPYLHNLNDFRDGFVYVDNGLVDLDAVRRHELMTLKNRPQGAELHRRFERYGVYNLTFALDFGSFRDLQRHRRGLYQVPLVTGKLGMHPWYMAQFEELLGDGFMAFHDEVYRLLAAVDRLRAEGVDVDDVASQGLYPMAINCLCQATQTIPQMVYVSELRSQETVHATLRPVAQAMGHALKKDFPFMSVYIDERPDVWSLKRGGQTITAKAS